MMTTPTLTPIMIGLSELTDPPLADGANQTHDQNYKYIAVQSNLAMKITAWSLQTMIPDMKLKNIFTPPTTGPAQLLELVLVAAALQ